MWKPPVFLLATKNTVICNIRTSQTFLSTVLNYLVWFIVAICSVLDLLGMKWRKGHKTDTEENNCGQITRDFIHHSLLSCQELFIFSYNMHIILISRRYTTSYNTYPNTYRDERELYTKACVTCNYTGTLKRERESFPKGHAMNTQRLSRKHDISLWMIHGTPRWELSNQSHFRGPTTARIVHRTGGRFPAESVFLIFIA